MEKKNKILVVEDDKFISEVYYTKLKSEAYDVEIAEDGKMALKKIIDFEPDLVLLDLFMPEMGGIEVLECIRKNQKMLNLPVIVLTNASEKEYISKAMDAGADDYLVKSNFTPDEVVSKVKKHL